jgi:geranylgeranyl diphosphate synthase type II
LLTAAVRAGPHGGHRAEVTSLTGYGEKFGLTFQITDDLLDVEGEAAEMGKSPGMDEKRRKATYPAVLGLEATREWARRLVEGAITDLTSFEERAEPLRELAPIPAGAAVLRLRIAKMLRQNAVRINSI